VGCYVDDGDRMFSRGPHQYGYNGNTCASQCSQIGTTHFSLQNGGWCACGTEDDFGKKTVYTQTPEAECGQMEERFAGYRGGGPWRNAVYKVSEAPESVPVFSMMDEMTFPGDEACMGSEGANAGLPISGSPYTIEAWVRPLPDIGNGGIVGWGVESRDQYHAFRFAGPRSMRNYWWSRDLDARTPDLSDGSYHHVAATWDGTTRRIFVDFAEVASDKQDPGHYRVSRTDNFCVGRSRPSEPFKGNIKRLKIWTEARSAESMRDD